MKTEEITEIALKAGEILLVSGAEIYRVEDTMTRICESYNVKCDSFVLPSGVFVSVTGKENDTISITKRIKARTVDLHRIELVNTFSRNLQKNPLNYEEAMEVLKQIENTQRFNFFIRLAAAGIAAFVFTLLFKGGIKEGTAALFISMLIYLLKDEISKIGFFQFLEFFISGMIAGGMSLVVVRLFPYLNIYKIIIGAITILLPGVAITNGVKDALYGDIISSYARLGEAVFMAVAVGTGVGIVLTIGLRWV